MKIVKNTWLYASRDRLAKIIEYKDGTTVTIPLLKDGSVKWFDDTNLLKKTNIDGGDKQ